jgi:hypothetical protein
MTVRADHAPYHVTSSRTTLHSIDHDTARPSAVLLPVIPLDATSTGGTNP